MFYVQLRDRELSSFKWQEKYWIVASCMYFLYLLYIVVNQWWQNIEYFQVTAPLTGDNASSAFLEKMLFFDFFSTKDNELVRGFFFLFASHAQKSWGFFFFSPIECDITPGLCSYSQHKVKLKLCLMTPGIIEWPDLLQSSNVSCHCCAQPLQRPFTFFFCTLSLESTFYVGLCCFIYIHKHTPVEFSIGRIPWNQTIFHSNIKSEKICFIFFLKEL